MKVPGSPAITCFWMEDIFPNSFILARARKHMGEVEQKRQLVGMVSLFLVVGHVKLISTLKVA